MIDLVYGLTLMKNESMDTFMLNLNRLKNDNLTFNIVLNTEKEVPLELIENFNIEIINCVGDMKKSRHAILNRFKRHNAKMYMLLDSDILIPSELNIAQEAIKYKDEYDFISLYYMGDPPIPAFFTLASSLNDYYNQMMGDVDSVKEVWFDDSDLDNPTYFYPNKIKSIKSLSDVIRGKSFARDIPKFTKVKNDEDFISGGSTIYFNKDVLLQEYEWPTYNGKSLIWYDSFRTYMMKKEGFKHSKVPLFLEHKRHNESINLNWNSVISYVEGYNKLWSSVQENHNNELMIIRAFELMHFQRGMIRKILSLEKKKIKNDMNELKEIKKFLYEQSDIFINYYKETKWK